MNAVLSGTIVLLFAMPGGVGDDPKNAAPEPSVTLVVGQGKATAFPSRHGSCRTGGGNILVTQPSPDTISVTMTGVAVARGHPFKPSAAELAFDLSQEFEVVFHSPKIKAVRLILWGRTVGLLRSDASCGKCVGTAEIHQAGHASICCGPQTVLDLTLPPRGAACGENLSIHDREGPVWVMVAAGKYTLHQVFGIAAAHDKALCCKPASAEFAPDPALDSDWISKRDPFHGAQKKDFGFQVILKVVPDDTVESQSAKPSAAREASGWQTSAAPTNNRNKP